MKVLELFAGSRSFSKEAEKLGYDTFTVDIKDFDDIDYVVDILDFDFDKIPFVPDVIWASPPCTHFSVLQIGRHWNKDHTPKTEQAKLSMKIVKKTIEIIKHFPGCKFFIENPRAKLRKLDFMREFERATVWYCTYEHNCAKPTDIWSNHIYNPMFNKNGWKGRAECFAGNRNCHHEPSPRGSGSGGVQGMSGGNYARSVVPEELCKEILLSI